MPNLLDIADPEFSPREIDLSGRTLTIRGVKAREWLALYVRFPQLRDLVEGKDVQISAPHMIEIQSAVVAAGTGHCGDARHERAARGKLNRDDLTLAQNEIVAISYPGHVFGPLLDAAEEGGDAPDTAEPATK